MEEFKNDNPGEDICPFCKAEIEEIDDRQIAAEDDGAFWVERQCDECGRKWRDYYDPDMRWADTCPDCGSTDIEVDYGEISPLDGTCAHSESTCDECGEGWPNDYTYSFSNEV